MIVETALDKHVPVSQGSHFFQNIISFGLGYMTVKHDARSSSGHHGGARILDEQSKTSEGPGPLV